MVASLREREMVVKQSLSVSLRERDREREQHQKEEAVQHFKALMADMVNIFLDILCCLNMMSIVSHIPID